MDFSQKQVLSLRDLSVIFFFFFFCNLMLIELLGRIQDFSRGSSFIH